jgi:hypothetical protein
MKTLALVFVVLGTMPLLAQQRKELYYGPSSEKLVAECRNITVLEPQKKGSAVQLTRCLDYLTGVVDGAMMVTMKDPSQFPACIPPQENVGDLARIVMKFSEGHPEYKEKNASSLVVTAIEKAFPCNVPPHP